MSTCQTPGAVYSTHIADDRVSVTVTPGVKLTIEQASDLDDELHAAIESVLAQHWPPDRFDTLAVHCQGAPDDVAGERASPRSAVGSASGRVLRDLGVPLL